MFRIPTKLYHLRQFALGRFTNSGPTSGVLYKEGSAAVLCRDWPS